MMMEMSMMSMMVVVAVVVTCVDHGDNRCCCCLCRSWVLQLLEVLAMRVMDVNERRIVVAVVVFVGIDPIQLQHHRYCDYYYYYCHHHNIDNCSVDGHVDIDNGDDDQ